MLLIGGQTCRSAQIHFVSAVRTVDHTRKWIDFLMFSGTALVLAKLLHQFKLLLSYDRLMSVLKDEPFFLRISHGFLVLVGLLVCFEIDCMPDVFGSIKNVADSFSAPAVQLSVLVTVIPTL